MRTPLKICRPAPTASSTATTQIFAKLKHLLRKASERTVQGTWTRIGHLLNAFTKDECGRYLANAGYASI